MEMAVNHTVWVTGKKITAQEEVVAVRLTFSSPPPLSNARFSENTVEEEAGSGTRRFTGGAVDSIKHCEKRLPLK